MQDEVLMFAVLSTTVMTPNYVNAVVVVAFLQQPHMQRYREYFTAFCSVHPAVNDLFVTIAQNVSAASSRPSVVDRCRVLLNVVSVQIVDVADSRRRH